MRKKQIKRLKKPLKHIFHEKRKEFKQFSHANTDE